MLITQSAMLMTGQHEASQSRSTRQTLRAWVGERPASTPAASTPAPASPSAASSSASAFPSANPASSSSSAAASSANSDRVTLSPAALAAQAAAIGEAAAPDAVDEALDKALEPRMAILKSLLEWLTGEKIEVADIEKMSREGGEGSNAARNGRGAPRAGFGLQYDRVDRYEERESMRFVTKGLVRTADGRQITISVNLSMSREFIQENRLSIRAGEALVKDPLVINFGGSAAQLTQTRFDFDLDSDGRAEKMPFVGAGSGLLALDRNGDGKINNGTELFGPQSGNGMAELAALDSDGNDWLDENDPDFARLSVWTKDAAGKDRLESLKTAGVGALYLESAATPFTIKDAQNTTQGQVRSTGVYLSETGTAGTIQQIDLAV